MSDRDLNKLHAKLVLDGSTTIDVNGVAPGTYGGRPPIYVLK